MERTWPRWETEEKYSLQKFKIYCYIPFSLLGNPSGLFLCRSRIKSADKMVFSVAREPNEEYILHFRLVN